MDMFRMLDYGVYQAFKTMGAFGTNYDVKETDEEFIFTMGVPGLTQNDVDVRIRNNRRLLIKSNKSNIFTPEFNYAFIIPCEVARKETQATIKDGILEVRIKKAEADEFKISLK